jgi:hemerythrin-like domain-containing protein
MHMMPIGPLMIEHRLIEQMIALLNHELEHITQDRVLDVNLIDDAVDFIKMYADRCHHGKEENILFRELNRRPLAGEHRRIMNELIEEHRWARETTTKLIKAKEQYRSNDQDAESVAELLRALVEFYPGHIEKEDKHFFMPVMDYFSAEEKDAILKEEYEFDQGLIHEHYKVVVAHAETRLGLGDVGSEAT